MINIEDYFEKGYVVTQARSDIVTALWIEIYTSEWRNDPSGTYKQMPEWYTPSKKYNIAEDGDEQNLVERAYGKDLVVKAPKTLIDTATNLINDTYFDSLRMFKENADIKYLHMWNGAEEIPWHQDSIDSSDTLIFIYLTEEPIWNEEWGGCLGLRKEVGNNIFYETKVLPNNGTMVVVNNTNPLIKHRVWELANRSVNRYTFSLCYTWK